MLAEQQALTTWDKPPTRKGRTTLIKSFNLEKMNLKLCQAVCLTAEIKMQLENRELQLARETRTVAILSVFYTGYP
ncbi:hypothetical protein EVAR_48870_1 [Eumeta japonica]|uniref:Uncharacterized protein n=1 Tax=Eumeta variegata TaxID=151549 RepID=A0A4C1Y8Z6_EUMVA|nr:hypothetical protein EVAR_48870_1 [Eumeta japonica]